MSMTGNSMERILFAVIFRLNSKGQEILSFFLHKKLDIKKSHRRVADAALIVYTAWQSFGIEPIPAGPMPLR